MDVPFHCVANVLHHIMSDLAAMFKPVQVMDHCCYVNQPTEEGSTLPYYFRSMLQVTNQGQQVSFSCGLYVAPLLQRLAQARQFVCWQADNAGY